MIADISGKGIAAALLMANLQANLRSLCTIAQTQPDYERLYRRGLVRGEELASGGAATSRPSLALDAAKSAPVTTPKPPG